MYAYRQEYFIVTYFPDSRDLDQWPKCYGITKCTHVLKWKTSAVITKTIIKYKAEDSQKETPKLTHSVLDKRIHDQRNQPENIKYYNEERMAYTIVT